MTTQSNTELAAHMALVEEFMRSTHSSCTAIADMDRLEAATRKAVEASFLAALESPERVQGAAAQDRFDEVLLPFLALMRRELHANTGKGDRPGWLKMDASTALLEVYHHLAKLQKAVRNNDGPAIMEYAADVANMSMMVLDVCGGIDASSFSTPPTAPAQDAQGVSAILDALRVGRVACEWAEKTAEVQQIAAAMELAKGMLSATPSPQAEKQPLSLDEIQAWAVRRMSALGPEGVTDPVAFLEEGVRWGEAQHGIVTKEST